MLAFVMLLISAFNASAQRNVLVEQFTNSGCPPCASNTPVVASYVNANLNDVLMLSYHTSFPYNDSMYYENATQSDHRVAFYGVPAVPTSRVDGNFFSGNLVPSLSTTIMSAGNIAQRYNINFLSATINGNQVNASVMFESIDPANTGEQLQAMIVLAEKNVLKSSYVCCPGANSETEYPWVVRKMLPDENGTSLVNTSQGGTDIINISWTATNFKDVNELRIVAFVQNVVTKAIYQSEIAIPALATSILELKHNTSSLFTLFPSITKNFITIQLDITTENSTIKIVDLLGNIRYTAPAANSVIKIETGGFPSGIYFAQVENGNNLQTKKFIITK